MPQPGMIRVASTAIALLAWAAACVVGPGGEFESLSSGTTGDPFAPDPVACDPAPDCGGASECCDANQPPVSLVPYACASDNFPNNWQCVAGACKQQWASNSNPNPNPVGCDPSIDDQTECRVMGFTCHEINGVGHCVATCTTDEECAATYAMPHATCETVDGVQF